MTVNSRTSTLLSSPSEAATFEDRIVTLTTVAATVLDALETTWTWGWPLRGGTPAQLIQSPYGPKYLTFFHSSGRVLSANIQTYFAGAYLFDPSPPFAITHVTRAPIVSNAMYNESFGW